MTRRAQLLAMVFGFAIVALLHLRHPGFSYLLGALFLLAWLRSFSPEPPPPSLTLRPVPPPPTPTIRRVPAGVLLPFGHEQLLVRLSAGPIPKQAVAIVNLLDPPPLHTEVPIYAAQQLPLHFSELTLRGHPILRATWSTAGGEICALIGRSITLGQLTRCDSADAWVGDLSLSEDVDAGRILDLLHILKGVLLFNKDADLERLLSQSLVQIERQTLSL